jgi:hypothetical protein
MFPSGLTDGASREFAWLGVIEKAVAAEAIQRLRAGDADAPKLLLDLARTHAGKLRLVRTPEVMAFPAECYRGLKHQDPAFIALRHCADVCALDRLSEFVADNPETLATEFVSCFANHREIATSGPITELERFDLHRFWRAAVGGRGGEVFDAAAGRELLGAQHLHFAWQSFTRRRAEHAHDLNLGAANATAHRADALLALVRSRVGTARLVPSGAWLSPCPNAHSGNDFEESLPRFCSTFALAARASGERRLRFAEAMTALRGPLPEQSFTAGLRALLELAPELLGFFLHFWQTLIKTSPHHD